MSTGCFHTSDGNYRVTARQYDYGAVLVVEQLTVRGWYHVADCRSPEEVGRHLDLSTLVLQR